MTTLTPKTPRNTSFSMDLPTLQFAWDSTSMTALKTCPRLYYYSIIQGYSPRAESVHLTFGLHYHSALEHYYVLQAKGLPHEEALRSVVRKTLDATWNRPLGRPWTSDHKQKHRESLLRTIIWYLDQFKSDPFETVILHDGSPAVELTFRLQTSYSMMTGEPVLWCGHLDRLAKFNDDSFVVDHKTTTSTIDERFFDSFSPNNQFSGYTFAGQVVYQTPLKGIVINGAQIAVSFSRFRRQLIMRPPEVLDEWYKNLGYYFTAAERYATDGYWPMNESACSNYGGCTFRSICSKSPSVRQTWLDADFTRRTWDPLVAREAA